MATSVALRKGTAAAVLLNKLFNPVRSVSAIPSVQRRFNTNSAQVSAYDDPYRSVDEHRRPDSAVSRRRDSDYFSDVFDPISSTRSLSQILNMMDLMMDYPSMSAPRGLAFGARRGWDAKEDDESLSLRFDMPGLDKDDVKISVEQNTLVVKGESGKESEEDEEQARRYSTRLDLPRDVFKLNEINAEMKNGVLKIVVPKVTAEKRKGVWQVDVK